MDRVKLQLKDICKYITDGKHGDCTNEKNSGYYFISAKDVEGGCINYENARQITEQDFFDAHKRTRYEALDVIISNSGTLGRMAVARNDDFTKRTTFQKSVAILKPDQSIVDAYFLYYAIIHDLEQLVSLGSGTAQKNLLLKDIRGFELQIPSLPIQRRIASILSAYDDLIENNLRRIKLLEEAAKCEYKMMMGEDSILEHTTLGEILTLNYGKSLKADTRTPGQFPVYGSSGVVGTHKDYIVNGPGLILGRKGNVGSVFWSFLPFYPIDTVYYITSNVSLYFLYHNLKYDQHFDNSDAAVPGLNRNHALSNPISLPNNNAIQAFDEKCMLLFSMLHNLFNQNSQLRQARGILLPKLMSGEIEVAGDNSASTIIEMPSKEMMAAEAEAVYVKPKEQKRQPTVN